MIKTNKREERGERKKEEKSGGYEVTLRRAEKVRKRKYEYESWI